MTDFAAKARDRRLAALSILEERRQPDLGVADRLAELVSGLKTDSEFRTSRSGPQMLAMAH